MNAAAELIERIEAGGGRFTVEGEELVVRPGDPAVTFVAELRQYKQQILDLLQSRAATPEESPIDEGWGLWLLEQCTFRDRCFGGVGALYLSLARWCADHGRPVPESRAAFVAALQAEGFQVGSAGLVAGLVLKVDLDAVLHFQAAPEGSRPPERATTGQRRNTGRRRP
jgi:hypothetical protein